MLELGFEEIIYTTTEPRIATFTQMVCMEVIRGGVGRELIIIPDIIQGTAQSKCDILEERTWIVRNFPSLVLSVSWNDLVILIHT